MRVGLPYPTSGCKGCQDWNPDLPVEKSLTVNHSARTCCGCNHGSLIENLHVHGWYKMQILKPVRVEHTYIQRLYAKPEQVFPLLCPVRETEWAEGWNPIVVFSGSGYAEPDCVFMTDDSGVESVWVTTVRDPQQFHLQMIKVTPGMTVAKITIRLSENGENETAAEVTYSYTALSDQGAQFVNEYTEELYARFMGYWEKTLNDFLLSGRGASIQ